MKKILFTLLLSATCSLLLAQTAWTHFNTANSSLPENSIHCFAFENDSTTWIGTEYGLAKLVDTTWTVYTSLNSGLPGNAIRCIRIDHDGSKWIGTSTGGLVHFNDTTWTVTSTTTSLLPDDFVRSFVIDTNQNKWIGTLGGLSKVDPVDNWVTYTMFTSVLGSNNIASLYNDTASNEIYAGQVNGGLLIVQDTVLTNYTIQNSGISDNTILDITKDPGGTTWLASPANGLIAKLPGFGWFTYNLISSNIPSAGLTSVALDGAGDLWMGSIDQGLIKKTGSNFTHYFTGNSPLLDDNVQMVRIANDGRIWIGTQSDGVYILDPSLLTGFEMMSPEQTVSVYPNPAKDGFCRVMAGVPITEITLMDLGGKTILKQNGNADFTILNLQGLTPGMYLIAMQLEHGSMITKKLIVY